MKKFFIFAMILVLVSCGDDGSDAPVKPTATAAPASLSQLNGTTPVVISFSSSMETATLALGGSMAADNPAPAWTMTSRVDDTLTLDPATTWSDGSQTLTIDVDGANGVAIDTLSLSYSIDATLAANSVTPASGTILKTDQPIVIDYGESMDNTTAQLAGTLSGEAAAPAWTNQAVTDDSLTISPATTWSTGAGTLDVSAGDLAGNNLALNLTYTVELDADGDGVTVGQGDCDDSDADRYPGNIEICDGKDNDCNGIADYPGGEIDVDGDGSLSCIDCNDNDPNNYPGNTEICDGQDNDCSGSANYPGELTDADGDGSLSCVDCADNNPARFPGNPEICDGIDNNCNGIPDYPSELVNNDGDPALSCVDCNDNDPNNYPGNTEICGDGQDNNCNGVADEGCL